MYCIVIHKCIDHNMMRIAILCNACNYKRKFNSLYKLMCRCFCCSVDLKSNNCEYYVE